jgi:CheY-like chemotaxis protein
MAHPSTGREPVVLVVEDEALMRLLVVDSLEDAGFEVLEAGNADEAIQILEGRDDIGSVFTDIDMPGSMDGLRLARAVRDRWPPIEILVTSGKLIPPESDLPTRGRFFPKPYDPAHIVGTLREMIK